MIDLHCHSRCSDGSDEPHELSRLADQAGLKAVALTDHDTLSGLDDFLGQQNKVSVRLLPGIELSCEFLGQDLHVLGLFVDHRDKQFVERVESLRRRRQKRNRQIFQRLSEINVNISPSDLPDDGQGIIVTRSHIAEMLTSAGHGNTKKEAFQKYIGEGGLAYAPFEYLSPSEAFKWIREAKGVPVVAHPGRFWRFMGNQFVWGPAMAELRGMGLEGIEAYYSEHSAKETAYFLDICDSLGMAPTGGSDYHGNGKPKCKLGTGYGDLCVPDEVLDKLYKLTEKPAR